MTFFLKNIKNIDSKKNFHIATIQPYENYFEKKN